MNEVPINAIVDDGGVQGSVVSPDPCGESLLDADGAR